MNLTVWHRRVSTLIFFCHFILFVRRGIQAKKNFARWILTFPSNPKLALRLCSRVLCVRRSHHRACAVSCVVQPDYCLSHLSIFIGERERESVCVDALERTSVLISLPSLNLTPLSCRSYLSHSLTTANPLCHRQAHTVCFTAFQSSAHNLSA